MNSKTIRPLNAAFLAASLVISAGAFADEPVMRDPATDSAQPGTDTWITTKVKADLLATDGVEGTKINVTTVNGVVTLAGVLESQAQVDKAIDVARKIKRVTDVDTRALTHR